MRNNHRMAGPLAWQRGFSLIELMVAITIGLFLLAGMVGIFASSSQSHNELEKAARQLENGRYAAQMLREEIELAGFFGDYMPISSTNWTTPDPCTTTLSLMGFSAAAAIPNVPTGIFGYESTDTLSTECSGLLASKKAGTDVLVIRRVSTTPVAITPTPAAGEHYLQVSNCEDSPVEAAFVMDKNPANFILHGVRPAGTPLSCKSGDLSPVRKYVVRVYFIANCNDCSGSGDGIPTLKMGELTAGTSACASDPSTSCGSFTLRPIAEGIENLQLEYGVDTSGDGISDTYQTADTVTTAGNWKNVVAAKAFLLARNSEPTIGYTDTKTYILNSSGDPSTGIAPGGNYRRHAYSVTTRANNISGRRQQ